jgi:Phytanoyl-CoA dioxygenase (PhyH)
MSEIPVGDLQTANHRLNDLEGLSALYDEEGYLFFRNVLDERAVLRAKKEFVRVLQQQGVAKVDESEVIWTGAGLDQIDDDALYALDAYQELLDLESTRRFVERIFAEPVFMYRNVNIRFALPNDEKHLTPAHQDHFFIRQTERFRTVWIPLMSIERHVGGLTVAARSHHRGLLEHSDHETAYSY